MKYYWITQRDPTYYCPLRTDENLRNTHNLYARHQPRTWTSGKRHEMSASAVILEQDRYRAPDTFFILKDWPL